MKTWENLYDIFSHQFTHISRSFIHSFVGLVSNTINFTYSPHHTFSVFLFNVGSISSNKRERERIKKELHFISFYKSCCYCIDISIIFYFILNNGMSFIYPTAVMTAFSFYTHLPLLSLSVSYAPDSWDFIVVYVWISINTHRRERGLL